jgi:DNA polymerase-3 subunit beta
MKLTIEQPALSALLGAVAKSSLRGSTIPIGEAVLLDAHEGLLHATCTDFDMASSDARSAEITAPGQCCPNASALAQFVKALPKSLVEMTLDGDRLTLRCGRSRATFPCLPPADFPLRTLKGEEHRFALSGPDLAAIIAQVGFAVSTEETRGYLNGVNMKIDGDALMFAATDGYRLSIRQIPLPAGAKGIGPTIIPRHALAPLSALSDAETIDIAVTDTGISARSGDALFITKLIDGNFPDYERIVPAAVDRPALIESASLLNSLNRLSAVAEAATGGRRGRVVKLSFNGALTVSAGGTGKGDADEVIDCSDAPHVEIGFNGRYLADAIAAIGGETVEMHISDAATPVLMRNPTDESLRVVALPYRV